jgi:hypothetical protein
MNYGVATSRHSQPSGEGPVGAGKPAPVAAKAAAINAAQAHPLTSKTLVKRALVVAVAGAAICLVLPSLIAVLGAWPRLSTLNPAWFALALALELASFTCNFALQRLALRTQGWFARSGHWRHSGARRRACGTGSPAGGTGLPTGTGRRSPAWTSGC